MEKQIYVDDRGFTSYKDVNEKEIAAIGDICKTCKGMCCSNFTVRMPTTMEGRPDWDTAIASADSRGDHDEHVKDLRFMQQHFEPTGRFGDSGSVEFICNCQDPNNGLCTAYADRPKLCQGYVCGSAWCQGKPPGLDNPQQSQSKGGKNEGFEPNQTVRELWKDIIQPRLAMEAVVSTEGPIAVMVENNVE